MALHLTDVTYVYPQTNRGVRHINATVPDGEWTALVGHSGSGKSTLLRLMTGLLTPQSGRIDLGRTPRPGLVMQFPEHHFFCTTVYDEVAYGLSNKKSDAAQVEQGVHEALQSVGLDPQAVIHESPFRLSGGTQRLVAIAAALALQPTVLLLDEPAAGLDPLQRDALLQHIDTWRRQTGTAVLLSSHDMDEVARWTDRLLVLQEGTLVYEGALLYSPNPFQQASDWDIGTPVAVDLLLQLHRLGADLPDFARTPAAAADLILKHTRKKEQP